MTRQPVLPPSPSQALPKPQGLPGPARQGEPSAIRPPAARHHIRTSACHGLSSIFFLHALALQDSPEEMLYPEQDSLVPSLQLTAFPTSPCLCPRLSMVSCSLERRCLLKAPGQKGREGEQLHKGSKPDTRPALSKTQFTPPHSHVRQALG